MSILGERAKQVEILGVSATGPQPLGQVHFRFKPGVSVLYGKNGVGKTALVRAIQAAFYGQIPPEGAIAIHIRSRPFGDSLEDDEEWEPTELQDQLADLLGQQLTFREAGLSNIPLLIGEHSWDGDLVSGLYPETAVKKLLELAGMADQDAERIAAAGLFTLFCAGIEGRGAWDVWASTTPDSSRQEGIGSEIAEEGTTLSKGLPFPFGPQTPGWVPRPLAYGGRLVPDQFPLILGDFPEMGLAEGLRGLVQASDFPRLAVAEGKVKTSKELDFLTTEFSRLASELCAELLEDAPVIKVSVSEPDDWLAGRGISVTAFDRPTLEWVPIEALSTAQKRWVSLSIWVVMAQMTGSDPLLGGIGAILIDEPEAALHVAAERHLLQGLMSLNSREGLGEIPVIVTTHSPLFLNQPDVSLHHVMRGPDGKAVIRNLEGGVDAPLITETGLTRSDVLQLTRSFVIVEGEHDATVLHATIGSDLEKLRARIVPMRGANHVLSIVDAQILVDMTDATIVVVLDRIRMEAVNRAWSKSKSSYESTGDLEKALRFLKPLRDQKTDEAGKLYELARRALESGAAARFQLFGMREQDIHRYLPVADFVSEAGSWNEVHGRWRKETKQEGPDFKIWMSDQMKAPITTETLQASALRLDHVPDDFIALLDVVQGN